MANAGDSMDNHCNSYALVKCKLVQLSPERLINMNQI